MKSPIFGLFWALVAEVEEEVTAHHTIEKMEEAGAGGNIRLPTGPKIRCPSCG